VEEGGAAYEAPPALADDRDSEEEARVRREAVDDTEPEGENGGVCFG
jgi:hypothetical protein